MKIQVRRSRTVIQSLGSAGFALTAMVLTACVDRGPTAPLAHAAVDASPSVAPPSTNTAALSNRLAYLWAQTASPPLNTPYAPNKQRTFNGLGLANSVTRFATGAYRVALGGMAKGATGKEIVVVTTYAQTKVRCTLDGWRDNGANLDVTVFCVDGGGASADARFSLLMVGANSLPGRLGFALTNDSIPNFGPYTPDPHFSWNATGNPITAFNGGILGGYTVDLGLPRLPASGHETFIATATSIDAQCRVDPWNWANGQVDVECFDHAGAQAPRNFAILQVEQGRPGMRFGFTVGNQPSSPTPYAPDTSLTSTTGGPITITRTQKGVYTVDFEGLQKPVGTRTENVQVSAFGTGYSCEVPAWPTTPSGTGLRVWVVCRNGSGAVADSPFTVLVLE